MIYRTSPYSATLNDRYPRFYGHTIILCCIYQKRYTRYRHTKRDLCPTERCHFEWPWVT